MGLTVGEAFPLVVPISQERLLTLEIVKLRILFFLHLVQTKFFCTPLCRLSFFFPPLHKQSYFRQNQLVSQFINRLYCQSFFPTFAQTKCSTCQCFPRAVTTLSSIGRLKILSHKINLLIFDGFKLVETKKQRNNLHAPQMGIPILSWQRRQ